MIVKTWYVDPSPGFNVSYFNSKKIKCCNCGNYCHSQCYGYSKGTVGANFECYECLLAESEPSILFEKIYPLCTRRRMVYYLEKHGFRDTEGLCQYMSESISLKFCTALTVVLDLNQDDTQNLIDTLRTEGIVKKCSGLSKEPFRFADLDKLHAELFDPSTHIGHTKLVSNLLCFIDPFKQRNLIDVS